VTKILGSAAVLFLAAVVGLAAAAAGWLGIAVVGTVVLGAVLLGALATAYRPPDATRLPQPKPPPPPRPDVVAVQRNAGAISWATRGPRWADTSLRPILAEVADLLVATRTGYSVRERPSAARELLGEPLFGFIDPARAVRDHDDGHGPTLADVDRMLTRLEELT
jgi:hypothetical protein